MDPYEYPGDEQLMRWSVRYGQTGVKLYTLDLYDENKDCIAVYREASMAERATLLRFEELNAEYPGSYEVMRMYVSTLLLYPNVDDYPHPAFAVGELYGRMKQHGHGPLQYLEKHLGQSEEKPGIPEHIVGDIKAARKNAYSVFHSGQYGSFYTNMILELCTQDGVFDINLFDTLWRMSPGRLRELSANIEQVYNLYYKASLPNMAKIKNQKDRETYNERLVSKYQSPFTVLDVESNNTTVPTIEEPALEAQPDTVLSEPVTMAGELPPNSSESIKQEIINSILKAQQTSY